MKINV